MINSYCDGLKKTFAELVQFGLLKKNDGQCFRVNSSIKSGSFLLLASAIVLGLMSNYVVRAVVQYFRDEADRLHHELYKHDSVIGDDFDENDCSNKDVDLDSDDADQIRRSIRPVDVLFSDIYRWTLRRNDNPASVTENLPDDDEPKAEDDEVDQKPDEEAPKD